MYHNVKNTQQASIALTPSSDARLRVQKNSSQNEPLFLRTYTDAEGEEEEDANLRLHNIVHSSLDVVGERKGKSFRRNRRFAPYSYTRYLVQRSSGASIVPVEQCRLPATLVYSACVIAWHRWDYRVWQCAE